MRNILLFVIIIIFLNTNAFGVQGLDNIYRNGFEDHVCEATDDCFYVAVGASSQACTFQDPCDLQVAKSRLSGGDYLYLLQGTYLDTYLFTEGAYGDYDMILAFGRSHSFQSPVPTSINRITIKSYPGHSVILDGNYDINSNLGAQCFYTDQGFITFSGFIFKDCKVGINIGENRISDDTPETIVENNTFIGTHYVNDNGGNVVVFSDSINAIIRNNYFDGPGIDIGSMNSAGVYFTHDRGTKILNNEISNHRTGIHYKHDHSPTAGDTGSVIAYNYIHDVSIAARLNNRYINIHDNITSASSGSFNINHCSGASGEGGDFNTIKNNYFYAIGLNGCSDTTVDQGAYQNTIKNNIIATRFYLHPWRSTPHDSVLDYNLYIDDIFENNVSYNLNQWQSYYGQDANSLTGVPMFTNPGLLNIADYKLLPQSIGYQSDENGNDIGPDTDLVGVQ